MRSITEAAILLAATSLLLPAPAFAKAGDPPKFTGEGQACEAAGPDSVKLSLDIAGVRSGKGNVNVTVYDEKESNFLSSGQKLARVRLPAMSGDTKACIALPKHPAYAIVVYHDENDNRAFDRTLVGLPEEGYGFSNDAPAIGGLPAFNDVRFDAPASGAATMKITLHY